MGKDEWVLKLQEYIQKTVKDFPKQKIVGVCWGHQSICVALGGEVGDMETAEIGVTAITLTEEGKKMFPFAERRSHLDMLEKDKIQIHEFHKREIKKGPPGFTPLAEENQAFINEANTIMTFQGHPEFNEKLGLQMLGSVPTYMGVDQKQKEESAEKMGRLHDGVEIWSRILAWVKE